MARGTGQVKIKKNSSRPGFWLSIAYCWAVDLKFATCFEQIRFNSEHEDMNINDDEQIPDMDGMKMGVSQ